MAIAQIAAAFGGIIGVAGAVVENTDHNADNAAEAANGDQDGFALNGLLMNQLGILPFINQSLVNNTQADVFIRFCA